MSTTDVHRMIAGKLSPGRVCSAVRMVEVYTATIDDTEFSVDAPLTPNGYSMTPEAVAELIIAQIGSTDNAAPEGGEAFMEEPADAPPFELPEEEEYDEDDEDEEEEEETKPAAKRKPAKPKAKPKRR